MEEMLDLQGLVSKGSSIEWPSDSNQRMELSRSLAAWAPGLKNLLANGIKRVNDQSPALRMLSATEQRQLREWQLHVSNGHKNPFKEIVQYVLKVLAETDQGVEFNIPSPTL